MPHIILECSDNIAETLVFEQLFQQLHEILAKALPTQIANFRSRVTVYEKYFIGDDFDNGAFIHLTLKILSGRTSETKNRVGQTILKLLEQTLEAHGLNNVKASIEILDLTEHYLKIKL